MDIDNWFTGKRPIPGACPGVNDLGILTSLPLPALATMNQESLLDYFDNTWTLTETLFAGLLHSPEAFYRRPAHGLRHPMIFYYGHAAVFYVNKFRLAGIIDDSIDTRLEVLLEVGVDENSWDNLSQDEKDWPSVEEVRAYRAKVYKLVHHIISTRGDLFPTDRVITMQDKAWAVVMAFEHERIHLETSSVLIRELQHGLVSRHPAWPGPAVSERTLATVQHELRNEMVAVDQGEVELGKPANFPSFGWDNEYGHASAVVPAFEASRYLITNGQFYEFVTTANGYQKRRYWSEDGWGQIRLHNQTCPRFWVSSDTTEPHTYRLRTIFDVVPMAWDWPVVVNYHEAKAYCAWRSERESGAKDGNDGSPYRLITEAEHHRLRALARPSQGRARDPIDDVAMQPTSQTVDGTPRYNLNLALGSESAVDSSSASSGTT